MHLRYLCAESLGNVLHFIDSSPQGIKRSENFRKEITKEVADVNHTSATPMERLLGFDLLIQGTIQSHQTIALSFNFTELLLNQFPRVNIVLQSNHPKGKLHQKCLPLTNKTMTICTRYSQLGTSTLGLFCIRNHIQLVQLRELRIDSGKRRNQVRLIPRHWLRWRHQIRC